MHLAIAAGDDLLDVAERFAAKARMLVPESSAAVLAHAEVLQAGARTDEIEPLVESFFATRPAEGDAKERRNRITLLLRLAELQSCVPKKAAASLERAAALSPDALGASERRRLAELYGQLGRRDETALDNHRRLLEQDPLFVPSLSALAAHHAETGELDHAWAIHALVDLVEPGQPAAREFLETHSETQHAPEGPMPEEWVEQLRAPAPPDAGVGEALLQLWEGGGSLLAEVLPRVDVPPDARVSPLGEGVVAKVWAEMLRRLGQQKVALVDTVALPGR